MDTSNFIAGAFFGLIGTAYFVFGKKQNSIWPMICGVVLMAVWYVDIPSIALYAVSIAALVLPFILR